MAFESKRAILGNWGEIWIDGVFCGNVTSFQAKVDIEKADVPMCGTLRKGKKITGISGKGSIKFTKINSFMMKKIADNLRQGKDTVVTIISKLDDPDSLGAERIAVKDATFDNLILAAWETGKMIEEEYPFTFSDFEYLDLIEG